MSKCHIPAGYSSPLSVYETQCAIEFIKHNFQKNLCHALNLLRVSAPLFVEGASGLNDNLNGYERPVSFDVPTSALKRRSCIPLLSGSATPSRVTASAPAKVWSRI